jgi:hypothetical protein
MIEVRVLRRNFGPVERKQYDAAVCQRKVCEFESSQGIFRIII